VPNRGDTLIDGLGNMDREAVAVADSETAEDAVAEADPGADNELNEEKDTVPFALP